MLDLIRLADDRWLVRASTTRRDGTPVSIEEVLVCSGVPNVEVVIDLRGDQSFLVLRERHDPDHVLVQRAIEPAPLRVVWDATEWDVTRARKVSPKPAKASPAASTGPVLPA